MKKLLALVIAATASTLQASSPLYTIDTLRKIEAASAVAKTSTVILTAATRSLVPPHAIPQNLLPGLNFADGHAGLVNDLMAYALLEQSKFMSFTRILEKVISTEAWKTGVVGDNGLKHKSFIQSFAKTIALSCAQGIRNELLSILKNHTISQAVGKNPDRLLIRSIDIAISPVISILSDIACDYLLEAAGNTRANCVNFGLECKDGHYTAISRQFLTRLFTSLAFHVAGEMIIRGTEVPHQDYTTDLTAFLKTKNAN